MATRLRPWIDIGFQPLRCIVEETRVIFEFELELVNSGSAPARDVLIEAAVFNAGPDQDAEIDRFFSKAGGEGESIPMMTPHQRIQLRPQLAMPLGDLRVVDAGGRRLFVPLIAFNSTYRWSSDQGQSAVSFLIGRAQAGEKMAPFRLDLGARVFRGVAARALPLTIRR